MKIDHNSIIVKEQLLENSNITHRLHTMNGKKGKYSSVHLVFYFIHFVNTKSLEDFMNTHWDTISNGVVQFIDTGVYGDKCMRMVECTKYGKERYLKIVSDGHDFQDAMISAINSRVQCSYFDNKERPTRKT